MSNMFSESKHKKFPRSVRACMETDPVSSGLWDWAATVERYGKFLLVATIILGIILFLSALFSDERGQAGFAFKVILPVTVLVSIGEYLSYHTIALLIGALASITQNTAISANMALYSAKDDPTVSAEEAAPSEKKKPQEKISWQPTDFATAEPMGDTNIRCSNCHRVQFHQNKFCNQCGAKFV